MNILADFRQKKLILRWLGQCIICIIELKCWIIIIIEWNDWSANIFEMLESNECLEDQEDLGFVRLNVDLADGSDA